LKNPCAKPVKATLQLLQFGLFNRVARRSRFRRA